MNCGIILFIYDRPQCTKMVLESLKKNHIDELYIFQDGLNEKTNENGWKQNTEIINKIDWCNIHYERNIQKAPSLDEQIIFGINKVFEEKDEVIVIEDDCIVSDDCIAFFEKCFEVYRDNKKVISIDAYLEPIKIPKSYDFPIIASGIPSSWGWGTWKNRWEEFQKDFMLIRDISEVFRNYKIFDGCGYPVKKILKDYWLLRTWDLWWGIYVLYKEGISIRPIYNQVYNIGFKNPGTHTLGESPWVVPISEKKITLDDFPLNIKIEAWADKEFSRFYREVNRDISPVERQEYYRNCLEKWIDLKQQGKSVSDILQKKGIERVVIYGTGTIGERLFNELFGKIQIEYFVVTIRKDDTFKGCPVYGCSEELPEESENSALIVVPGYDLKIIKAKMKYKFSRIYSIDLLFDFE